MASLNTIKKAQIVKSMVSYNYKAGRQDKCKLQAYRNVINKQFPMSERTFWRLLSLAQSEKIKDFNNKDNSKIDFNETSTNYKRH
ncbi:MAG: hypothetical protein LBS01_07935 [Prevotellaceae bacterium]|jgi:hypothetical protein|nr:hypothetical protein [Prevotellaceae bacterium]